MSDLMLAEADIGEVADLAGARAAVYGFLSQLLLGPPTDAALARLRDRGFVVALAASLGLPLSPELDSICKAAHRRSNSLIQEYHDLFLVPLERYVAPYEAVYRGSREIDGRWVEGPLQNEYTVAVLAKYRQAGVQIADDVLDLPDHIGLELAFMQSVCEMEQNAWLGNDSTEAIRLIEIQKAFLDEHLGQWVPCLCQRVQEKAKGPLYRGIAHLTRAFIAAEQEIAKTRCKLDNR